MRAAASRGRASTAATRKKLARLFTSGDCFLAKAFLLSDAFFGDGRSKNVVGQGKQHAKVLLVVLMVQLMVHPQKLEELESLYKVATGNVHIPVHVLIDHKIEYDSSYRTNHRVGCQVTLNSIHDRKVNGYDCRQSIRLKQYVLRMLRLRDKIAVVTLV